MRPGIEETAMADEDDELEEEEGDPEGVPESDDDEEGEEGEGGAPKKFNKIKFLIILSGVIFFLFLIGLSLFFFGILDPYLGLNEEDIVQEEAVVQGQVFYKLQDMTINLNEEGKKPRFMKVGLTLVLIDELDVPFVEALQPRIEDYITTYLRELRPEELSRSANFYRMRENLLLRVRAAVAPVQVNNVLFNSVLVQ
jgi:flagellar FliL protein